VNVGARRIVRPDDFFRAAGPFLLKAEAENCLILGVVGALAPDSDACLVVAEVDGEVVACAMRSIPHKAVLSAGPGDAMRAFARDLFRDHADLPAIVAPEREAAEFAAEWRKLTGASLRRGMHQGIYELDRVDWRRATAEGRMRIVKARDRALLGTWIADFCREARVDPPDDVAAYVDARIRHRATVVWETDRPVALAGYSGATPNGVRISLVYTPPENRGQGYATTLVATLSDSLLREGRKWCFLFTDLSNPISNRVYERIGYRRVGEVLDVHFQLGETSE
jgi:predicted GNAT family acetyltransferase